MTKVTIEIVIPPSEKLMDKTGLKLRDDIVHLIEVATRQGSARSERGVAVWVKAQTSKPLLGAITDE